MFKLLFWLVLWIVVLIGGLISLAVPPLAIVIVVIAFLIISWKHGIESEKREKAEKKLKKYKEKNKEKK